MPWRVISYGKEVWHVQAVAELRPNEHAWQLVLSFRASSGSMRERAIWADGRDFVGESEGMSSPAGELRCAAEAAVKAFQQAVDREVVLELLGVKSVRAFDATVVIVSLSVRSEGNAWRMVGSYLTETDP